MSLCWVRGHSVKLIFGGAPGATAPVQPLQWEGASLPCFLSSHFASFPRNFRSSRTERRKRERKREITRALEGLVKRKESRANLVLHSMAKHGSSSSLTCREEVIGIKLSNFNFQTFYALTVSSTNAHFLVQFLRDSLAPSKLILCNVAQ